MPGPKKKSGLRKTVRQIEDEFGVDKTVEDIVDGILSIFDTDDEGEDIDTEGSLFGGSNSVSDESDSDDSSGDFGDGDFGGGGSDDDW